MNNKNTIFITNIRSAFSFLKAVSVNRVFFSVEAENITAQGNSPGSYIIYA